MDVESRTKPWKAICAPATEPELRSRYSPTLGYGHRVKRNLGVDSGQAPDMLATVEDGFTTDLASVSRASWEYRPLSADNAGLGCAGPASLYAVDPDLPRPEGAIPFTSSMRVVARFDEPNGVGSMNGTCYGYETAVYSRTGRGFLGFRKVIEQEEIDDGVDYSNQRNRRTVTTYEQDFPCTGNVVESRLGLAVDSATREPLELVEHVWQCQNMEADDAPGVYRPYLEETTETKWPLQPRQQGAPPLSVRSRSFSFATYTGYPETGTLNQRYGNVARVDELVADPTVCHRSVARTEHRFSRRAQRSKAITPNRLGGDAGGQSGTPPLALPDRQSLAA
jgi:hypothetical protein